MEKYYIKFKTPIGNYSTPIKEITEGEIDGYQKYILSIINEKIDYVILTHDNKTFTYLPKQVLLNSVIELRHTKY